MTSKNRPYFHGYFNGHREIVYQSIFVKNDQYHDKLFKFWYWCMTRALWSEEYKINLKNGDEFILKQNQFIFSKNWDSKAVGVSKSTAYRYLHKLEEYKLLKIKKLENFSLVTMLQPSDWKKPKRESVRMVEKNKETLPKMILYN